MARDNEQDIPVASQQIPRATLQALSTLTRQIESLNDFLVAQRSPNQNGRIQSELQAVASRQRSAQVAPTTPPTLQGGPTSPAGVVLPRGASLPPEPPPPPPTPPTPRVAAPSEVSFRKRLKEGWSQREGEGGRFQNFSEGFLNPKLPKSREVPNTPPQPESSTSAEAVSPMAFPPSAGPGGAPSNGKPSSIIPGMSEDEVSHLQASPSAIPQFGEWQLDTKLKLARDWIGKYAAETDKEGNLIASPARQTAGTLAGYLNYAAGHAAQLHAARRTFDRFMNFGGNFEEMGKQLGYNPQSGLGASSYFGFRNPLAPYTSEAGQQGMGIRWDAEKMARFHTGITSSQAQEIYGVGAGMGFSNQQHDMLGLTTGGDLENISTKLIAPIVKETGISPEVAWQFANSLRNGNTSMKDLSKTLKGLPEAAKAARETINQIGESVIGFAEEAEQYGANKGQAYQTALGITQSTGLDPRIIGQQMSNPLFQGLALTHLGVLPSGLGALPGGTLTNLSLQALKMTMGATAGLATPKYETIGGHRIEVQSGEAAQIRQAAQLAGIPPEIAERMWRERSKYEASGHAATLLESETSQGWKTELSSAQQRAKRYQKGKLSKYQEYLLEHGGEIEGHHYTGWNDISQQLQQAGMSKKELQKLSKEGFGERAKNAENYLTKLNKQNINEGGQNTVNVKFTGLAAKFFEQEKISAAKASSNAGGASITSIATSPIAQALSSGNIAGAAYGLAELARGVL